MTVGGRDPDLRLIVITDGPLAAPRTVEDVVREALEAGAPAIQLRIKEATAAELFRAATFFRELTRRYGALLFVNDRLDVALAAGADGVHLGPEDLPVHAARAAVLRAPPTATPFLIGFSTDDPAAARAAQHAGADYIGCGAVFGTTSKAGIGDERIGLQRLAEVVRSVRIPVVGIGGITPDTAHQVRATGAAGLAVIGAVMAAREVAMAVRGMLHPSAPGT